MAEGKEQLRIEIKDLDFDVLSSYTGEFLMIALDEDGKFKGIRIDIETTVAGEGGIITGDYENQGLSFWITEKKFPELFRVFKEHVIPAALAESKKPGFEEKYKIIKKKKRRVRRKKNALKQENK